MVQLARLEWFNLPRRRISTWKLIYVKALMSSFTNTRWWTLVDPRLEEI